MIVLDKSNMIPYLREHYEAETSTGTGGLYRPALHLPGRTGGRLRQGRFFMAEMFERFAPEEVHVISCSLEDMIDSKSFRQPVYVFRLDELKADVFVPAFAG